jgi:hypothetical protein
MPTKQKQFTFGTCSLNHLSPPSISPETRAVNIVMSFEDALKLNLAISEGVRALNKNNRATREGRDAALCLTVYLDTKRMSVNQAKVKQSAPRKRASAPVAPPE